MLLAIAEAPAAQRSPEFEAQPKTAQTPNSQLRKLVASSGLPTAVAMTIFDR